MSDELHCADVEPYLSAFADGELAEPLRSEVAAHVRTCDSCSDEVDRYQTIDQLVASLPRTLPSPEVFARVQAAVAQRHSEYVRREPIDIAALRDEDQARDSRNGAYRLELPAPVAAPKPAKPISIANRANARKRKNARRRPPTWMAGALPTVAALLLVAMALTLLLRFSPGVLLLGGTTTHTNKPHTTAEVLKQTRDEVALATAALAFTPTLPTYLPSGASYGKVTIGPSASGVKDSHYLDMTWTFASGPLSQLRVREAPARLGFPDYALAAPATANPLLFWELPQAKEWMPLTHQATTMQDVIVGQQGAAVNIVVDAQPGAKNNAQDANVIAMARIVSLSMDRPFDARVTVGGPNPNATLHFIASVTNGSQMWQVESYLNTSQSDTAGRNEMAHITGPGVNLLDTTLNGQTTRLDENQHLYQTLPAQSTAHAFAEPQQNVIEIFYLANQFIQDGEMWYTGKAQYQGRSVNAFALVNSPGVTLYADATTNQAIALVTLPGAMQNSRLAGSGVPASRLLSTAVCQNYTVTYTTLEYVTNYTFTTPDLSQDTRAQANASLPTGFTCGA